MVHFIMHSEDGPLQFQTWLTVANSADIKSVLNYTQVRKVDTLITVTDYTACNSV